MKKRLCFVLVFSFVAAVSVSAQTRTVTNADLEKFRQKRVAAERDLRENYERLGFPSPAELEKQIEKSRVERSELAARLEAENLQRERLKLERERIAAEARALNYQRQTENYQPRADDYLYNSAPNGFFSFPNLGFPNYRYNRRGFGNGYRRGYGSQPRIEYRNNLPVVIQPPRPIFAPRTGGRRN
jgi:hypothetical protein